VRPVNKPSRDQQTGGPSLTKDQILEELRSAVASYAEQLVAIQSDLEDTLLFEKSSMEGMGKWLLATLVAINGAAALGLMSSFADHLSSFRLSVILFTGGVASAVLSGLMERDIWATGVRLRDSAKSLRQQFAALERAQTPEEILHRANDLKLNFKGDRLSMLLRVRGFAATSFFYLSLGCFIAGIIAAGSRIP